MKLFKRSSSVSTIDQDFITRYWDLVGRVDALEAHLADRLDELEKRYKRAEQSERRLKEKQQKGEDCEDCDEDGIPHANSAIAALKARRKSTMSIGAA